MNVTVYVNTGEAEAALEACRRAVSEREIENAIMDVVQRLLHETFELSQALVPVRTGQLKETATHEVHRNSSEGLMSATISYGPSGTPAETYAELQHENTLFRHLIGTHHYLRGRPYSPWTVMEPVWEHDVEQALVTKQDELIQDGIAKAPPRWHPHSP
jgi:hypothetical protein